MQIETQELPDTVEMIPTPADQILKDYFADDLLCRKKKHAPLLGAADIDRLRKQTSNYKYSDVDVCQSIIYTDYEGDPANGTMQEQSTAYRDLARCATLTSVIDNKYPWLVALLKLYPKNLFVCGGAVVDFLGNYQPADIDIFFCCNDAEEADIILRECLEFLKKNDDGNHRRYYSYSQHAVTIHRFETSRKWVRNERVYPIDIQFIRRVYKSPDQILLGFDIWACKHGWNPELGYFTISTGAISLVLNMFPIDTTQISYTYARRLKKYLYNKCFRIWLPGVNRHYNHNITTPDGIFSLKCSNGIYYSKNPQEIEINELEQYAHRCKKGCSSTIFRFDMRSRADDHREDERYDPDPEYVSIHFTNKRYELMVFMASCVDDIFNPLIDCEKYTDMRNYYNQEGKLDPGLAEYLLSVSSPAGRWKTKDPGSQNFGRVGHIIESPSKWYGFERKYYAGIHPDVFVAIANVRKQIWKGMPRDIFHIIMELILRLDPSVPSASRESVILLN